MLDQPIVCVDVETTGTSPQNDRITEIGVVELDPDGTVREWSTLVNPGVGIPPFIQQLTGISDAMVESAPTFAEVAEELQRHLVGRLFVAHNVRFDYGFIRNEFKRLDTSFHADTLCTVRLSRRLYPQHFKHNLDSLIQRLGIQIEDRHRALSDARVLATFLKQLPHEHDTETIHAAMRHVMAKPVLPAHIPEGLIDDIPDRPGVWLFYGENDTPLHIGRSTGLRSRVLAFLTGSRSRKELRIAQQLKRIEWRETAGELGAMLLEARLIKELQPLHNQRLNREKDLCTWQIVPAAQGGMTAELRLANDIDFGRTGNLYGLFPTPRKAIQTLRELAEAHRLCLVQLGLEKPSRGGTTAACSAYSLKKCRGVCVGKEDHAKHDMRLIEAIARLKIHPWPHPGPIGIIETYAGRDEVIVLDGWAYLGIALSESEFPDILAARPKAEFDLDIYKILAKNLKGKTILPLGG
jgi:DNA polymerase-3 subunit epsilon